MRTPILGSLDLNIFATCCAVSEPSSANVNITIQPYDFLLCQKNKQKMLTYTDLKAHNSASIFYNTFFKLSCITRSDTALCFRILCTKLIGVNTNGAFGILLGLNKADSTQIEIFL